MKVIGITGGVGTGKTLVLTLLEKHFDADIIIADEVAHQLMNPGQESYLRIVERFGSEILNSAGAIDKKNLSKIIFGDEKKRNQINQIVHPLVKKEIKKRISESQHELVIVEAALLIEDHYDEICDELWYVYASKEVRIERLMRSRGYTEAKCHNIMASQLSDEEYRRYCQRVIHNEGTHEEVLEQLKNILQK